MIEISQQKLLGGGKSANSFPGNNEFQSVEVKKKQEIQEGGEANNDYFGVQKASG